MARNLSDTLDLDVAAVLNKVYYGSIGAMIREPELKLYKERLIRRALRGETVPWLLCDALTVLARRLKVTDGRGQVKDAAFLETSRHKLCEALDGLCDDPMNILKILAIVELHKKNRNCLI